MHDPSQVAYATGYQDALADIAAAWLRNGPTEALAWVRDNLRDSPTTLILLDEVAQ